MYVPGQSILCFCLFLKLILFTTQAHAQQSPVGPDSRLYNGREYIRNGTPAKGFPFFIADSLQAGSVFYDGILYPDIALEYDMVSNQLIIHDFSGNASIALVREKITRFSIGAHHFRCFSQVASGLPEPGFYEELYAGRFASLLAHRKKILVFPSSPEEQPDYTQVNAYFLLLNGAIYPIGKKAQLLEALKDEKDPLKKYIRKNHLSFNRQIEQSLIQTIAYYQQLKS